MTAADSAEAHDGAYGILFRPGRIGGLELANRIVMPPMTTRGADDEGFVTERSIAYYRARALGGVGLVTVEMASPERAGRHRFNELGVHDDRFVPGLARLVEAIHGAGARASIQLGHGGGHTRVDVCGETPVAPSAVPHPVFERTMETIVPEAMTEQRIAECVAAFVAAALRVRAAGFDAVELHVAHGYLLSQFLCPAENRREDAYGGPLANRARITLDMVRAIKAAAPGFPLIVRMNGDDYFPGGITRDEARQVARWVADAGADAIHVTGGHYRSVPSAAVMIPPMAMGHGPFVELARAIRADVGVPVIAVGRLGEPGVAAEVLASGAADFVALGRPLLADPEWPRRVHAGRAPRACLGCNTCVDQMRGGSPLGCLVNPTTGREAEYAARDDRRPRGERIAVVGAGPAGLSYAALAAADNAVTVFERRARAGGAFHDVPRTPLFQNVEPRAYAFEALVDSLERRCREHGAELRYRTDALRDPRLLAGFDRVVIATGATYRVGLGPLIRALLRGGLLTRWPLRSLASRAAVRDWLYHRARRGVEAESVRQLAGKVKLQIIGDAAAPGRSQAAIESAFRAAYDRTQGLG